MTDEFPGNSRRSRDERNRSADVPEDKSSEKRVEPLEGVGKVTRRKKPLGKRIKETLIGGSTEGVGTYVLFEVLIPAARDTMLDAGEELLARILLPEGERRGRSRRGRGAATTPLGRIAYDQISARTTATSRSGRTERERPSSIRARARRDGFEFEEIVLEDRHIAEEVLDRMYSILEKYKLVTVADLYEILGETVNETITDKWGWDNLMGSRVHRVPDGYLIDLPRPMPIDD